MNETAKLLIAVETKGAPQATAQLNAVAAAGSRAEVATTALTGATAGLLAPMLSVGAALGGLMAVTSVSRQFQVLEASLRTATGSAEKGAQAFDAIKKFAAETPYDLAQVTSSFLKLVNLGLDPSERALTSYGNTASALGKNLDQMIEAVADAATGEFERLKEFGIKARTEGDQITFRFRGITTTVRNSAQEIERYLLELGENNFAGTMSERMNTLDGALSNLSDSWSQLLATIGKEGGFGNVVESAARQATQALTELTNYVASGQMAHHLKAIQEAYRGWGRDVAESIQLVTNYFREATDQWKLDTSTAVGFLVDAFILHAPQNIRAGIQVIAQALYSLVEEGRLVATAILDVLSAALSGIVEAAKSFGRAFWDGFFQDGTYEDLGFGRIWDAFKADASAAIAQAREAHDLLHTAAAERLEDIAKERQASIDASAEQVSQADRVRKAYDAVNAARSKATGDQLAEFRVGGTGDSGISAAAQKKLDAELERTRKQLATELELTVDAYEDRQAVIDAALERRAITEEEFATLSIRNAEEMERKITETADREAKQRARIQQRSVQMATGALLNFATETARTFEMIGEKGGAAQKAAFAISKGVAIAQAIVNTEVAATRALAEGGTFAGIPLASLIRATGYASVALIGAQTIMEAKQYEHGGFIAPGAMGIVGEAGPEVVRGPAYVQSARRTADAMDGGGGTRVSVVVNNHASDVASVEVKQQDDGRTLELVITKARDSIARDIRSGGGIVSRAIEQAYSLPRARG